MRHYLAMLWDVENRRAAEDAERFQALIERSGRGWVCELCAEGLMVLRQPSQRPGFHTYMLPNSAGVVLGQLFTRAEDPQPISPADPFSAATANALCATGGRQLISDYWGNYVAFLCSPSDPRRYVIRDCSGQMPCYRRRCGGMDFVFSDIDDLNVLQLGNPSVDWTYVAAFIYRNELQIRNCALEDVTELLAGDCFEWSPCGGRQYSVWSPAQLWDGDLIHDYGAAAGRLRQTTQGCTNAWASEHRDVVHSLSGGFDSAVVLACLSQAKSRPSITCLNRYAVRPGEDERHYARLAAIYAATPLVEAEWKAAERAFDERVFSTPRTAKPSVPMMFAMLELEHKNAITQQIGASTMTTGQGGDHLFFRTTHPIAAADFIYDHGITPRLLAVTSDTARLTRTSFWAVAKSLLAHRYFGREIMPPAFATGPRLYVSPEALPSNIHDYMSHPWSMAASASSPGRQYQAFLFADLVNRHRPLGDLEHAEELHPLISQPLMELCLKIPSYLLVRGGRQRALARDAFAADIPWEIRNREDKGAITSVVLQSISNGKEFLRELMLDGVLVRERIIDRREIEGFFSQTQPMRAEQIYPLLSCIAAEAWVQAWSGPAHQHAAGNARVKAA